MNAQRAVFGIALVLLAAVSPTAAASASNSTKNATAAPVANATVAPPTEPILQPNTSLNEFENATVAAVAVDPGDEPVLCPLTTKNISDADMSFIKTSCDTSSLNGKNAAGSKYCLGCGCALDVAAYKTMHSSSLVNKTTDDDLLDSCAQWTFDEAVKAGALDANAVAALKVCAPIDFVCKSYSTALNSSYITNATEDQFSVLGSGVQDAVQSAAGNASAAAAAAAHAARSSAAAASVMGGSGAAALLLLLPALLAILL